MLCELLPVALPCLALCLKTVIERTGLTAEACNDVAQAIGHYGSIPLDVYPSVQGGFHEYLVAHNRTNPLHVDQFINTARKLLVNVEALYRDITKELSEIYHQGTVEEWLSTYVSPCREKLKKLVSDADLQIAVNVPV
uniref:Secreted protein n=2 Tax=Ixodes ricinus TaxID=34613 RepID=V5H720_IXORI